MDKLTRVASSLRWLVPGSFGKTATQDINKRHVKEQQSNNDDQQQEATCCFTSVLENVILWKNPQYTIFVIVVLNLFFWGIVVLEIRGFAAASSAALALVLCYSTLEVHYEKQHMKQLVESPEAHARREKIAKVLKTLKNTVEFLKRLRENHPGTFCAILCSISLCLWLIGRTVNGIFLAYVLCMGILLGPALVLQVPTRISTAKEWDSEIDEFLPAVTEDNLQVLKRAGEIGDNSSAQNSAIWDSQNDCLNDDDLLGLKMPSHDDGSTDGVELSELELSSGGETDVDGSRGHRSKSKKSRLLYSMEEATSSEEEVDFGAVSEKLPSHSEDSESEFEIIDSCELNNYRDT